MMQGTHPTLSSLQPTNSITWPDQDRASGHSSTWCGALNEPQPVALVVPMQHNALETSKIAMLGVHSVSLHTAGLSKS